MKRSFKILAVGLGVVSLVALAVGTTVFADSPDGTSNPLTCDNCSGVGFHGGGITSSESVASLLGLTTDELCELRAQGLSLTDIAAEKGISLEELTEAIIADRAEIVKAMVDEGLITQEQADFMLERISERIEVALTRTTTGPAEWGMGNKYNRANTGERYRTGYNCQNHLTHESCYGDLSSGKGDSQTMYQHGRNR